MESRTTRARAGAWPSRASITRTLLSTPPTWPRTQTASGTVSKGGRERERFSDPDASWGHRSAREHAQGRRLLRLQAARGLTPLRVRGIERVALHADLTMLARLSQALARARAVPLAA